MGRFAARRYSGLSLEFERVFYAGSAAQSMVTRNARYCNRVLASHLRALLAAASRQAHSLERTNDSDGLLLRRNEFDFLNGSRHRFASQHDLAAEPGTKLGGPGGDLDLRGSSSFS